MVNKKINMKNNHEKMAPQSYGASISKLKIIIIFSVLFLGIFCFAKNSLAANLYLDEVRLYSRVLSPSEIMDLYRLGAGKMVVNTPTTNYLTSGLVGNWTFNGQDISGTTAYIGKIGTFLNFGGKIGTFLNFGK